MKFSIGITIHNEERNIGRLLDGLRADGLEATGLARVLVVSSGSTDRSDAIVTDAARGWDRVELIVQPERRGKASAINLFIAAARAAEVVDVLVLMSGDVLPAPGAIARILAAFADPAVGMAGGRPVPSGRPERLIHHVVQVQWELHHEVALVSPKLGEVVAFRNVLDGIPADTAVDEAAIEALLRDRGLRMAYVADAVIANKGPDTLADFLRQRRRIAAGHQHLASTQRYAVSTSRPGLVLGAVARYLLKHPRRLPVVAVTAVVETLGQLLGTWDLRVRGKNPFIWDVAASTKQLAPSERPVDANGAAGRRS